MRNFEFIQPASLAEAVRSLNEGDESTRVMSGGTALMLMMKTGLYAPKRLISLAALEARYSAIEADHDGGVLIGATATLSSVEISPVIKQLAPSITQAMKKLANVRVRNVARVGGALAHGDPHMDLPPILASLGGELLLLGPTGERRLAVESFYTGYLETALLQSEIITGVRLPPQVGWCSAYMKCTTRAADDWPTVGVATSLRIVSGVIVDARIMVGAATERLTRLTQAEAVLRMAAPDEAAFARAADAAAAEASCVDSASGSAAYKTELLRVYVRRTLAEALLNGAVQ